MAVKKTTQKKGQKESGITAKTTLAEVLKRKGAEKILAEYGVPCMSCPFAKMEMEQLELGYVCEQYGIDLDGLLNDLNKK